MTILSARDRPLYFRWKSKSRSSSNWHKACLDKARAEEWKTWRQAGLTKKSTKDWNRWTKFHVASVCQHCSSELQHTLPHEHRVRTQQNIPRSPSVPCPRLGDRQSSAEKNLAKVTRCPRYSWANRNDLQGCSQTLHAFPGQAICLQWRKLTPENWDHEFMCMSYNQKQIIKERKLPSQIFPWLVLISLKRLWQLRNTWCAESEGIKNKFFIQRDYGRSRLETTYLTYRSRPKNGRLSINIKILYAGLWESEWEFFFRQRPRWTWPAEFAWN